MIQSNCHKWICYLIPLSAVKDGSNLTYFQSKVRQSQNNDIYICVFAYFCLYVFVFLFVIYLYFKCLAPSWKSSWSSSAVALPLSPPTFNFFLQIPQPSKHTLRPNFPKSKTRYFHQYFSEVLEYWYSLKACWQPWVCYRAVHISKWWVIKDDLGRPADSYAGAPGFGAKSLAVQQCWFCENRELS